MPNTTFSHRVQNSCLLLNAHDTTTSVIVNWDGAGFAHVRLYDTRLLYGCDMRASGCTGAYTRNFKYSVPRAWTSGIANQVLLAIELGDLPSLLPVLQAVIDKHHNALPRSA